MKSFQTKRSGASTCHLYGVIPGRIQMERFIPVEWFRKKAIPSKVLPYFFPLLPERPSSSKNSHFQKEAKCKTFLVKV